MKVVDGITATEGYLEPPSDGDRHCLGCGTNLETTPHPLHVECDESVNTSAPRCRFCCSHSSEACADCCQHVGEWLTDPAVNEERAA